MVETLRGRRVTVGDVARGALRAMPELLRLDKAGLLRLATLRPTSHESIGRVVERWARRTPDRVALRFEDQAWTYAELNAWANRVAGALRNHGVRFGDTVGVLMDNRPELLVAVLATVKLGAVAGLLNPHQRERTLAHSVGLLKTRVLVVTAECRDALESTDYVPARQPEMVFLWHGGDADAPPPEGWHGLATESAACSPADPPSTRRVRADQPCYYIFTSGTTGLPKASVMSHYRWLSAMGAIGGLTLHVRPDDVVYCCLPLYHNNAMTISWGAVLSAGATLAVDRRFSVTRFWDRVRHYDATAFSYIGELLRYLLNQAPSPRDRDHRLRFITGNGLRPELWTAFEERFGVERIYEFYGASELNIAFVNAFGVRQTAGFTPMSFAIVKWDEDAEAPARDARGFMQRVERGGVGLLISKITARRPFDGYTDPAAGDAKVLRDVFARGDAWFDSGDLVRDQGLRHIQFVDRVGDTFRWKGENVATSEVEAALARQAMVEHGVVYGVTVPGADGRCGMAALTLAAGATFDGQALARALHDALPAYAVPRFLRIRSELETTGTFKPKKGPLKRDGFDPTSIPEPLYVLLDPARGYEPLTAELFAAIAAGERRL
ncbi:MAG: long-chain-acyl-CoA synthetase [Deltaproteobacteria bacterium]|nr:MAG: long-chain-acyl-CoA synthetase [Deltaproteobacteria bacterium]